MTSTEDLIRQLAAKGAAPANATGWRFALPLLVVSIVSIGVLLAFLGSPFLSINTYGPIPLIAKWTISLPLALGGASALFALGHPGRSATRRLAFLGFPVGLVALLVLLDQFLPGPTTSGASWSNCLIAMAVISPIGFAAAILSARALAPTQLRQAGLAAALFGGGLAISSYSPFCPELGIMFFLTYYAAPVAVMALIGWLAGPRLLRW